MTAGGGTDVAARILAAAAEKKTGQPLVGADSASYFRDMHERCKPLVEAVLKTR